MVITILFCVAKVKRKNETTKFFDQQYTLFNPPFSTFIIYSLAPCSLLLAPYETEQAGLAKVEYIINNYNIRRYFFTLPMCQSVLFWHGFGIAAGRKLKKV